MSTFCLVVSIALFLLSLAALLFSPLYSIGFGVAALTVAVYSFILQFEDYTKKKITELPD
jgi:hypothetical protein